MRKIVLIIHCSCYLMPVLAFAGPGVTNTWSSTNLSQSDCMVRAETVIKSMKPDSTEISNQTTIGSGDGSDGYTYFVRCVTEKQIVFFGAAGPSLDNTKLLVVTLRDRFR
ncbi:hypothetical protein JL101_036100 (plasmid) [Skermanella rosea]|uniref:hypothetical protein n=1 Tax=Skermanella rosea TaxID=1817965 RepID=UPI001932CF1C|nr:hypothetical protein [Skermanella rosea]UEM08180.1 hypothetical protein JL101_036100 [Skermanella rosea]